MLLATGSSLVAGSIAAPNMVKTKHIRAARAFYWQGAVVPLGRTIEVPAAFAAEMVALNKAAFADPPPAAKPEQAGKPVKARMGKKE